MKIGIIGSGVVGQTIGAKLVERGEDVVLGTRSPGNLSDARGVGKPLEDWLQSAGSKARVGAFADAAAHGEIVINATSGTGSLEALGLAGQENLRGKILIDVSNPLDFSRGMPPLLTVCNTDSLAEQIQREFPDARVVKSLNTMNAAIMVNPALVPGMHDVFLSGNDANAKEQVRTLLHAFGWTMVVDLGDITTARGAEMLLPLWLRLMGAFGSPNFNFHLARA